MAGKSTGRDYSGKASLRGAGVILKFSLALLLALLLISFSTLQWRYTPELKFGALGVPWCRSKNGATVGWTQMDLIQGLREFVPIYANRPIKNNAYGMGFDHSFGLWFLARWLQPQLMIESGAFKGHSTWVMRQAMPNTPIISITPRHPQKYLNKGPAYVDTNCRYFAGKNFIDFGSIRWNRVLNESGIRNLSRVLIFFDDHQNELRRIIEAKKVGFRHLIFEDNYDTGTGDHYSLRQICDQLHITGGGHSCDESSVEGKLRIERKNERWEKGMSLKGLCSEDGSWWGVRGEMRDNFNHSNIKISLQQHMENARKVESMLDLYWELPPVVGPKLSEQKRYDPARTSIPIVVDNQRELFDQLKLNTLDKRVLNGYTQMAYARLISE